MKIPYIFSATLVSALLFAAHFLFPYYAWPCALLFLIPLFSTWMRGSTELSFWQGCVWGTLAYSIQAVALLHFIAQRSVDIASVLVPGAVIGVMAVSAGVWFWCVTRMHTWHVWLRAWGMIGTSLVFFLWIDSGVLCVLTGQLHGYPFSFPLLALWNASLFVQQYVALFGSVVALVLLMLFQLGIASKQYKACAFMVLCACAAEYGMRMHFYDVTENQTVVHACAVDRNLPVAPYERAVALAQCVEAAQYKHPEVRVWILPESVFPFYDQELHLLLARIMNDHCLPGSYVIAGVYKQEGGRRYNSCICMHQGRIIYSYDKKSLIPFFEYVPGVWGDLLFAINGTDFIAGATAQVTQWNMGQYGVIKPQICAELFWPEVQTVQAELGQEMKKETDSYFLVGLVNDRHFVWSYFSQLMRIVAHYKAAELNKKLIYSSYADF